MGKHGTSIVEQGPSCTDRIRHPFVRGCAAAVAIAASIAIASAVGQDVVRTWDCDSSTNPLQNPSSATAGDVDGDAVQDVMVCTYAPPATTHTLTVYSGATGALIYTYPQIGIIGCMSTAGDVDADGHDDFMIGDPFTVNVRVYSGRDGILIHDIQNSFKSKVAPVGDVDGDGHADFAASVSGSVRVYSGADAHVLCNVTGSYAGSALDGAGDIDGDGVPDFWMGNWDEQQLTGVVYAYSPGTGAIVRTLPGESVGDSFGFAVANAGDVDGDAVPDLVVSAPRRSALGSDVGKVYVYSGATSALIVAFDGEAQGDVFGLNIARGQDIDGDGSCEIIVAAVCAGTDCSGRVYVYSGASHSLYASIEGSTSICQGDNLGYGLSAAGDIDGDGYPDIFVSALGYCSGSIAGRVYAYSLSRHPRPIGVSVDHARYTATTGVTIAGKYFTAADTPRVTFHGVDSTNVVVLDDATLICDAPPNATGPAVVSTENSLGRGDLAGVFTYTPAVVWDGDPSLGGSVSIRYRCDPKDGIFAIAGLPPDVAIPTPPFDGALGIVPFTTFFVIPPMVWPFDQFTLDADIPNDPSLSGLTVLLQALAGPSFAKPKDASWTNCAAISIK